ncbi:MAG: sigma-70 family RNA polymerase sigma factor [Candidatus Angelobacter sp.]
MWLKTDLEPIIASAYSEGQVRFGDLGLDLPTYGDRIDSIARKHLGEFSSVELATRFVKALHGRDLYLASACAQSVPGMIAQDSPGPVDRSSIAWKMLENTYKGLIYDLVRFFYRTSFVAQDLADNILADLFLPDRSGHSRIASYDGRSSLGTWLRVVICNRSINAQRCSACSKSTDLQPELPDAPALANIELTVRAQRYGTALEDSLALACRELTPRERLMLLWRYQDGLQLGQIARLLGIHQSNVTRQLERLQGKLRDDVIANLSSKHQLSRSAIQECLEDIVENPRHEVSILEFVKATQGPSHENSALLPLTAPVRKHSSSLTPTLPGLGAVKEA